MTEVEAEQVVESNPPPEIEKEQTESVQEKLEETKDEAKFEAENIQEDIATEEEVKIEADDKGEEFPDADKKDVSEAEKVAELNPNVPEEMNEHKITENNLETECETQEIEAESKEDIRPE